MVRYYATVAEARNAASLDAGFDPFVSGGWGRCTKATLADHGYVVDPAEARRQRDRREGCGRTPGCGSPGREGEVNNAAKPQE